MKEWGKHFDSTTTKTHCMTLSNCSHYGMVEQEDLYSTVIISFLHDNET